MAISALNNQVSFGRTCDNSTRISELENKRAAIQWASEGCNADLSVKDAYELDLRREYQALLNKHFAIQHSAEGCNGSLIAKDATRMELIATILNEIAPKNTAIETKCECDECKTDSQNPYGVPDSTFWGDWAR